MQALHATIQLRWSEAARLANALLFDARALRASDFDLASVEVLLADGPGPKARRRREVGREVGRDGSNAPVAEQEEAKDGILVWIARILVFLGSTGVGFASCRYLYISSRK
jgi:hypothetical protein